MDSTGLVTAGPYLYLAGGSSYRQWIEALAAVTRCVNSGRPEREVGDLIARTCVRLAGVDRAAVLIADDDRQALRLVGADGLSSDYIEQINGETPIYLLGQSPAAEGPSSRVFRTGRSVGTSDIQTDPTFAPWRGLASEEGFRALYAAPLIASEDTVGVLTCYNDTPEPMSRVQRELIDLLADHAALAMEALQLRRAQEKSINELTNALDAMQRNKVLHKNLMQLVLNGGSRNDILLAVRDSLGTDVYLSESTLSHSDQVPLSVAGEFIGALHTSGPLDEQERTSLEAAGMVIAFEHQRQITVHEVETRHMHDLLHDVLTLDENADAVELAERAQRFGHSLDLPHFLVVMRPDAPTAGAVRRIASDARWLAPKTQPLALTSYRDDTAVFLVPATEPHADFARRVHDAAQRIGGAEGVSTVVGPESDDIRAHAGNFATVKAALQVRQHAGLRATLARFDELGAMHLLLQCPPADLISFSNRILDGLITPTYRSTESLVPTLRSYMTNRRSTAAAAKELAVHPNTINNRLERIAELTGGSVDDTDHLLDLRLALLVHDVLGTSAEPIQMRGSA